MILFYFILFFLSPTSLCCICLVFFLLKKKNVGMKCSKLILKMFLYWLHYVLLNKVTNKIFHYFVFWSCFLYSTYSHSGFIFFFFFFFFFLMILQLILGYLKIFSFLAIDIKSILFLTNLIQIEHFCHQHTF